MNLQDIKNLVGEIDQIAFGCTTLEAVDEAKRMMSALFGVPLDDWTQDTVVAVGAVRGDAGMRNKALLNFNYKLGIEFELLHYIEGRSWLDEKFAAASTPVVPSHVGIHVDSIDAVASKFEGLEVVQEVFTKEHTNPYLIEKGRKYRYRIYGAEQVSPFDIKLIERIHGE